MNGWMRHVKREVYLLPVPTRPMSCTDFYSRPLYPTYSRMSLSSDTQPMRNTAWQHSALHIWFPALDSWSYLTLFTSTYCNPISGWVDQSSAHPVQFFFLSNSLNAPSLPAIQLYTKLNTHHNHWRTHFFIKHDKLWILNCWSNKIRCYWCALYSFHHPWPTIGLQ